MTKLEKLNARLGELSTLLDAIDAARGKLYDQERMDLANVLEKFFTPEEGDAVDCSHQSVNIRKKGADKYDHFLTIYVDDSWNEDDTKSYNKLYISNSSFRTDEISEWVIERFEKQAHYSRIAVDFQDDILAEMNQITSDFNALYTELAKPAKALRKEAREIREEINAIEKEARLKALMSEEGLEIKGIERERWGSTYTEYPDLEVKWDWTVRNVRGLRIDRTSASGKSADITVKVKRDQWSDDGSVLRDVIVDQQIERVRMDKIESFLRFNQIEIA